jgi:maltooligosyltrehalose trehalohydrolase
MGQDTVSETAVTGAYQRGAPQAWPPGLGVTLGAIVGEDSIRFRLFTTRTDDCQVKLYDGQHGETSLLAMRPLGGGYFEATLANPPDGLLYNFVLAGRELPDPYARFLPFGVDGPALAVRSRYRWRHAPVSRPMREQIIYELHVGTFTEGGTYGDAEARLAELAALGVTTIQLMPLSTFAGRRGWGYDGVAHFAPFAPYGTPDELRAFIDEAHRLGLSVLLDVVYNHFGAAGNYLAAYSPDYFTSEFKNAWGDAPNFQSPLMRRFVLDNARYWLTEFQFDGLRLDATHALHDPSWPHILRELSDDVALLQPTRLLIAEDERNNPAVIRALGMNAVWADDFHHQVRVLFTRERDGYYAAYEPDLDGLAATIRGGWLYQGQIYPPTNEPRGKSARLLPAEAFVYCIQNHDQVGNRAFGDRLSQMVSTDAYCAASALLLLLPMTPLLFMGQEWAATSPFQYFTDHDEELGRLVSAGRRAEFTKFEAFSAPDAQDRIPDPQEPNTFRQSKLRWEERNRGEHLRVLTLYQTLIELRRTDPVLSCAGRDALEVAVHGSVLAVRRWTDQGDRLLLVNFSEQAVALEDLAAFVWGRPTVLRTDEGVAPPGVVPGHTAVLLGSTV